MSELSESEVKATLDNTRKELPSITGAMKHISYSFNNIPDDAVTTGKCIDFFQKDGPSDKLASLVGKFNETMMGVAGDPKLQTPEILDAILQADEPIADSMKLHQQTSQTCKGLFEKFGFDK